MLCNQLVQPNCTRPIKFSHFPNIEDERIKQAYYTCLLVQLRNNYGVLTCLTKIKSYK